MSRVRPRSRAASDTVSRTDCSATATTCATAHIQRRQPVQPQPAITQRSVVPCTISVNSVKPVAMMPTWRLMSGGMRKLSVTASASASVTAPRRPPHRIASR
jgi:hypothetical protein